MRTIELTRGLVAKVSDEDYEELAQYKWCAMERMRDGEKRFYAQRSVYRPKRTVLMHCVIMGVQSRKSPVDHLDHDSLNNTRENLRITTNRDNTSRKKGKSEGKYSSTYVGVHWNKSHKRWIARISVSGRIEHLGVFQTELEASEAYQARLRAL